MQIAGHLEVSYLRQLIFVFDSCRMCWHPIGCGVFILALIGPLHFSPLYLPPVLNTKIPKHKNCKIGRAIGVLSLMFHLRKGAALRESAHSLSPGRITTMSAGKVMVVTAGQKGSLKLSL